MCVHEIEPFIIYIPTALEREREREPPMGKTFYILLGSMINTKNRPHTT